MGKTLGYGEITVANMTEPFTVMLTNEAQQFATDSNRKVTSAQSYYTDIIVIRGSQERTDYTIGNITSGSGITVSKSSKRVTFSVSAGTTIGADAGVIEIPITLDGQTVKKQFSWSCGKQGPQGAKGNPGTSITITSKSVTYQASSSGTTTPTGTWSTSVPTVNNGQYLWTKTTVQYSDGNKTEAYSVSYKGTNGTNGTSVTVSKTEVTYQVSTSGTTAPTGTWSTTMPTCDQGLYLWTKTYVKYSDGKDTTSYAVSYKGVDGEKFAFNMLRETNQGSKHWHNVGASGKYSVESITTDDNINAAKLICTEAIASNEWQFCNFTDYEMLKSLKALTTYVLSYDIKTNRSGTILHNIKTGGGQKVFFSNDIPCKVLGNETWEHISITMTTSSTLPSLDGQVVYMFGNALSKVGYSIIKNLKLTEGTIDTPWAPHPEDLEGRGVSETVQYYLATSQASGVTSSTSGWSTDITTQKLTADKKYLWNCYQTKYSDGTSEPISTPKVIGVYGDKGVDGQDGEDGAGFHWNLLKYSGDLSKQFLGGAGTYTATVESIEDKTVPSGQAEKITYTTQGTGGKFIQTGKYIKEGDIKQGKTYTISVWCKCSSAKSTGVINAEFLDNKTYVRPALSTEWQQYVVTGVANKDVTSTSSGSAISFYYGDSMAVGDIFYISSPKVEESDKPSPWCTTYEETLAKNLSITPSSQYFKSTDGGKTFAPNTITIKPTIQGEISFSKWQYSIDGGVSFADVVSGQKGLTISNNVLSVSKDSNLYSDAVTMVTFRAVANDSSFYDTCSIAKIYDVSDIGDGRNLLLDSSKYTSDNPLVKTDSRKDGFLGYTNLVTSIELEAGQKYVIQAQTDGNWTATHDPNGADPSKKLVTLWLVSTTDNLCFDMRKGYATFTIKNSGKYHIRINQYSDGTTSYTIKLWNFKLEKGSSPTGWTPAPEDVQTAILSTKSEISDVSSQVDKNKQAIEQRVTKTTYQEDLKLVKGDISKANEGLNKWRYEIYPKSLFVDKPEDQSKITLDVFARNKNIIPTQSILLDDTKLGLSNYDDNYIGYAVTFVKMSEATKLETTFVHDDAGSFYLNGKLICTKGSNNFYSSATPDTVSCTLVKGWNCLEVVINEGNGSEGFKFGTVLSQLSTCQLMNCYYAMVTGRESQIANTLVQNTIDIKGVTTKVNKVTSVIGEDGKNFTDFKNDYSEFKQTMNGFKTTVGQTYVTKSDFDGLEIGGRNLILNSAFKNDRKEWSDWGNPTTREIVSSNGKMWAHIVGNKQNYQGFNQWTPAGSIKEGDHITFSARIKGSTANQRFTVGIHWLNSGNTIISQDWHTFIVDTTENVYTWTVDASGSGCNKLNLMVGVSDPSVIYNVYFTEIMVVKGNKSSDWTPAPEDDEINGQNLVSNLPSNWEQGSFQDSKTNVGCDYDTNKSSMTTRIRVKELVPVSGTITISNAYSNQSKKPIQHWITAFDVNKKWLGSDYVSTAWSDFPRIVDMKDAKYIAVVVRYKDDSAITPSDISQICLKIERGTSATPFTLAPEDVNGKIVNVETIANQTAKEFSWIVKGGDKSSSMVLTDDFLNIVANKISLTGKVTFNSFDQSLKDTINNKANVSYMRLHSGGDTKGCWKIATINIRSGYVNQEIIIGVNHRHYGYTECRIKFQSVDNEDPGLMSFRQTGQPPRAWEIIKTAASTWDLYLWKTESWDGGRVVKYINPYDDGLILVTWSGENADVPSGTTVTEQMIADQTTIDGGIITTGFLSADRIAANSITADKIATDAIKSRNYISSGGTQGSFLNLSDGSFTSPNLSWDSNGNLIATGANLSGKIKATTGKIGLWTLDGMLYDYEGGLYSEIAGEKSSSVWAYDGNYTAYNFATCSYQQKTGFYFTIDASSLLSHRTAIKDNKYWSGACSLEAMGIIVSDSYYEGASVNNNASDESELGNLKSYTKYFSNNIEFVTTYSDYGTSSFEDLTIKSSIYQNYEALNIVSNSMLLFSPTRTSLFSTSDPSKYNAIETTGDAIIGGNCIFEDRSDGRHKVAIYPYDGCIEMYGNTPYIDFHYGNSTGDYTSRIIAQADGVLNMTGGLHVEGSITSEETMVTNRDMRVNSWLYCSEVHSSGAVVIGADSESFYWAHGMQIARGTSWGGVCIGDDSHQLRLYGSSIWASHGISTSDENLKENFTTLDQYEDFYMNLNPIGFNYIGDYDGKKTHFGFGAHKTEDLLESEGYDSDKFAVVIHRPLIQEDIEKRFGKDVEVDIETEYGISYIEFIALNTHMIQKTRKELTKVKQEKADLEARLQAIEAKLGL